jgi:ubiquinone/menaquinone biosynthesis C-methylase UbiE
MNYLSDYKTEKVAEIISENIQSKINNILVVGCGSGLEAAILAKEFNTNVIGIDIEDNFSSEAIHFATLEVGNAMSLRFPDSFFDFIYSFHTLEHISNPLLALKEMKRVLKDGGGYWIGTPNKNRIVGYIGSKSATLDEKIKWNLTDWKARLTGKFENDKGAHAGFSIAELELLLKSIFHNAQNVSDLYYSKIYDRKKHLIQFLIKSHLSNFAYPCVYYMGHA